MFDYASSGSDSNEAPGRSAAAGKRAATDALPPRATPPSATSAAASTSAASLPDPFALHLTASEQLREAASVGRAALWAKIDELGAAAIEALPAAGAEVLELVWPSDTGWRFSGTLQAAAFVGIANGLEFATSNALVMSIMRSGTSIELHAELADGVGGAGEAHDGIEVEVGGIARMANAVTYTIDLARMPWPPALLDPLRRGDPRRALAALIAAKAQLRAALTTEIESSVGADATAEASVGSPGAASAGLGGSLGVTATHRQLFAGDREVDELSVTLDGAISLAAEISPALRDYLVKIAKRSGAAKVWPGQLDGNDPGFRGGDLLPGPSDSANSVNDAASLGVRFRMTKTQLGAVPTVEVGWCGSSSLALAALGQSAALSIDAEQLMPIAEFIRLPIDQPVPAAQLLRQPIDAQLELAGQLQDLRLFGLDVGALPGIADRMDAVSATLTCSLQLLPERLLALPGVLAAEAHHALELARLGHPMAALRTVLLGLVAASNPVQRMFAAESLREVSVELACEDNVWFDAQTKAYGEAPGAQSQGGAGVANLYRVNVSPQSPAVSLGTMFRALADRL